MGTTIKNLILGLIGSKKFVVLVSGLIVTALAKYNFNLDPLMVQGMIGALIAYLIGQGIADNGKDAAKIEAVSASSLSTAKTPEADKAVEKMADEV